VTCPQRLRRRAGPVGRTVSAGRLARAEEGYIAVWVAVMAALLVGMIGLSVDVGHWYSQASDLQNMADSGALAGVVFMPGELADARTTAEEAVRAHGAPDVAVDVEPGRAPNQLRVTTTRHVDNFFVPVLGFNRTTIRRTAVAEFSAPVVMGSPDNSLGNDPERPDGAAEPQFWLGLAGPQANKLMGDRFSSRYCQGAVHCVGGVNEEFNPDGYTYALRVPAPDGRPLRIQMFDPSFVNVGQICRDEGAIFPAAADLDALKALAGTVDGVPAGYYDDADRRYAEGPGPWCTGDNRVDGVDVESSVVVRAPDATPWVDSDNPVIARAGCQPTTFPAFDLSTTPAISLLSPKATPDLDQWRVDPTDGRFTFAETWRRWVTVCEIPADRVVAGDYLIQVRSSARASDPTAYDAGVRTAGQNFFSLRGGAAVAKTSVDADGTSLFAKGRLPIYANVDAAQTEFYAARVDSGAAESARVLTISFYDVGDAVDAGTLQVLPPDDAHLPGGVFRGCRFSRDDGVVLDAAPGDRCQVDNVSSATGFNGQLMTVDVPLPTDYHCDVASPRGCWARVKVSFPGKVYDFTTWSAQVNGNPVRLIE
jgi:hypothetical protein